MDASQKHSVSVLSGRGRASAGDGWRLRHRGEARPLFGRHTPGTARAYRRIRITPNPRGKVLHPAIDLKLVNPDIGYGVFATQDIPKGTIIWALDPLDQIIDQAKAKNLRDPADTQLKRYSWVNGSGDRILCWDFGRFMNHCCEPTSVGPGKLEFEIAVRDIAAGEEVTCDYGTFNLEEPMTCACGSPHCRGQIVAEDFDRIAPILDLRVRAAFRDIQDVHQPLWPLVQKWRLQIERGIAQPTHLPSLLENRWPRVAVAAPSRQQRRANP
ncbi:MAG: hypothetical protein RL685_5781 [Pseudomonadota bacterium]